MKPTAGAPEGAELEESPGLGGIYLGLQGDEWDAQKDMLCAALGAALAMAITGLIRRARSSRGAAAGPR